MKKLLVFPLLILLFAAGLRAQKATPLEQMVSEKRALGVSFVEFTIAHGVEPHVSIPSLAGALSEGALLDCDEEVLNAILRTQPQAVRLRIPRPGKSALVLELLQRQPFAAGFVVTAGRDYRLESIEMGVHYAGVLAGSSGSLAAVSIFPDRIAAVMSTLHEGNMVLGQLEGLSGEKRHVFYREKDLKGRNYFLCHTPDDVLPEMPRKEEMPGGVEKSVDPNRTVRIFAVADDDLYRDKGSSVPTTAQYVAQVLHQCGVLFSNESVNTQISQIHVWDGWDPYPNAENSALLSSFEEYHGTFNGNVAHLLHTKSNASGGRADVGTSFCSKLYGISKVNTSFSNVPTYSWTINVVAHELGHNFGSRHTHACAWNGNNTRIDNCGGNAGNPEGTCDSNPPNPAGGGTIMSYCHLIDGVGVNFNNGFGPQPGNRIRSLVHGSSCLEGPIPNMATSGVHTLPFNNSYQDFLIPVNLPPAVFALRLTAKGGDGGVADGRGDCNGNGGVGATIVQTYRITPEGGLFAPGNVIRFVVGGAGESPRTNDLSRALGAGGGGGTGILVRGPLSTNFGLVLAAGGGGGGYSGTAFGDCVTKRSGGGGSAGTSGNAGSGSNAGGGGSNGFGGNRGGATGILSGGGGGTSSKGQDIDCAFTSDRGGGGAGGQTGAQGGISCSSDFSMDGGFGYGGGGAGKEAGAGGGGGGYSGGGGGGEEGGGGGGGSFILPNGISGYAEAGGNTGSPANGYARYEFIYDETPPTAVCTSGITLVLDPGTGTAALLPTQLNLNSTDNETGIDPSGFTASQTVFGCIHTGSNTVTLTVRDKAGNMANCQTTVTVVDNTPPTLVCQNLTLPLNAQGDATIIPEQIITVATDACGIASLSAGQTVFNCSHVGPNTITVTALDNKGNISTCQSVVTVVDQTAPDIQCSNLSITFNGEPQITLPLQSLTTASDACGIQSLGISPSVIPCSAVGQVITVTATALDANNNQSVCTSQVTVQGLPCGFSQDPDGIGCNNGNTVHYDPVNETFTLISSGCYYSSTSNADQMAYTRRQLCGNGEIIARLDALQGMGWAGVSMRESSVPGSKKVALLINNSSLARREIRMNTGGATSAQQLASGSATWVRLVRSGNQITGFLSVNGQQWQPVLSVNVSLPACIEMGLVASSAQPGLEVTGVFSNVNYLGVNALAATQYQAEASRPLDRVTSFPNPSDGIIQLHLRPEWGADTRIEILNSMGRLVHAAEVDASAGGMYTYHLQQGENGYYLLRILPSQGELLNGRVLILRQP